jgi:hypothetical protein
MSLSLSLIAVPLYFSGRPRTDPDLSGPAGIHEQEACSGGP